MRARGCRGLAPRGAGSRRWQQTSIHSRTWLGPRVERLPQGRPRPLPLPARTQGFPPQRPLDPADDALPPPSPDSRVPPCPRCSRRCSTASGPDTRVPPCARFGRGWATTRCPDTRVSPCARPPTRRRHRHTPVQAPYLSAGLVPRSVLHPSGLAPVALNPSGILPVALNRGAMGLASARGPRTWPAHAHREAPNATA